MSTERRISLGRLASRLSTDLRDATRSLRSGHGTTLVAFVILTLTMAAATVTFSVVDAVALRQLPYGDPHMLVSLTAPSPRPGQFFPAAPQDYFAWSEGTAAFDGLAASAFNRALGLDVDGKVEQLRTVRITANLFDVLRVRPAAGRFLAPEHERPGAPAVAIISHALWTERFGADPGAIGRLMPFDDGPRELLGVLPAGLAFPINTGPAADVYVPYIPTERDRTPGARAGFMTIVGRLREGVTLEQAKADANRVASAIVAPLHEQVVGPAGSWLLLMLAGVTIVLLVACANVANLLLARATMRLGEFATREALGASRSRIAGGLLLEGLLIAIASVTAALVLSYWGLEFAKSRLPAGLTRVASIALDLRVLLVSLATAVGCGALFASAPAWFASRSSLVDLMKGSGRAVAGGRQSQRALGGFLVANVSFVTILLVATALVVTTFVIVNTKDLGFDRSNVMLVSYERSIKEVPKSGRQAAATAIHTQVLEAARRVPGVTAAAISQSSNVPLAQGSVRYGLTIPGVGELKGSEMLETSAVTPEYFSVVGMRLVRGRLIQASDGPGAPSVLLITEAAAERYFAGRDPVGEVVTFRGPATIVGVVGSVHMDGPEHEPRTAMFVPLQQEPFLLERAIGTLAVRTSLDPRGIAEAVREAIRPAIGGEASRAQFLDDYFRRVTESRRFNAGVMAIFGVVAVLIGAIGVYGTMAFFVARQVRTIGVQMALGATPGLIMRGVVRTALTRVAVGVMIGLTLSAYMSSALQSFVFGVTPTDLRLYSAVAGFLGVVGFAAAFVPALRASRLDPLTALRED